MSFALSTGVSGLQAHQKMLDIAGNNLANINTTAFKSSRITFSELLSETIKKASQPTTGGVGGTNPQQMGSGVGVSGISPLMTQGNIISTGNPLDMAVEGEGYFVLSDGSQEFYTRAGTFAVDANSNLVEPSTGYIVQRTGATGESDDFQLASSSNISVPYKVRLKAKETTEVTVAGNLSAADTLATIQAQKMTSKLQYFTTGGTAAVATDEIDQLVQFSGGSGTGGQLGAAQSGLITFSGYKPDGTTFALATPATDLTMTVGPATTLQDLLDYLNTDDGLEADEVQEFNAEDGSGDAAATGGHFHLTFGGVETGPIDWDANLNSGATIATNITMALESLPGINVGDVVVSGNALDEVGNTIFTFDSALDDVGDITFDIADLTGGPLTVNSDLTTTTTGRAIQGMLGSESAATLANGKLVITDVASGYSESDLTMAWSGNGTLEVPAYFDMTTVGAEEVKNVSITIYDSLGGKHTLSAALVRTDAANKWDMVLTSVTGNVDGITMDSRRIKDIEFDSIDGSYKGLGATPDARAFVITFEDMTAQTISIDMGTLGQFNGLTQFAGSSTAVAREQDGYEPGDLSSVSVNNEGTLIGAFSNGIKRDIADLKMALFQNTSGLESVGGGYFIPSANSGIAVTTTALVGGAGSVHGGSLEKSNADVATEFVNMIQAQNGFQANARTIRVANEILRELTNLIR